MLNLKDVSQQLKPASGLFPTATFSYISNGKPRSCTVVLRDFDEQNWTMTFFTDRRSVKFKALMGNANFSLCLYSRALCLQAVMTGQASLHVEGKVAENYWKETAEKSLYIYGQIEHPGEELPAPFLKDNNNLLSLPQARNNFCVVKAHCRDLDLLQLKKEGNQRFFADLESMNPRLCPVAP